MNLYQMNSMHIVSCKTFKDGSQLPLTPHYNGVAKHQKKKWLSKSKTLVHLIIDKNSQHSGVMVNKSPSTSNGGSLPCQVYSGSLVTHLTI
jgi:hypothetical protein